MLSRRSFLSSAVKVSLCTSTAPLWMRALCQEAHASASSAQDYRALIIIHLSGGHDANNAIVPLDDARYGHYAEQRRFLALPQSSLLPITFSNTKEFYGLHPNLPNFARLINQQRASVIANAGPINRIATKAEIRIDPNILPPGLLTHPAGVQQWQSGSNSTKVTTGWGGRLADLTASSSGRLPPILNGTGAEVFTVGDLVQCTAFQGGATLNGLPSQLTAPMNEITSDDMGSNNRLIREIAKMRSSALAQQALVAQAQSSARPLSTSFPTTGMGGFLKGVTQMIDSRSFIGANRQMFFTTQGSYDTHQSESVYQIGNYAELDGAIGAFMQSLDEIGMTDQVTVCTTSDFNRTYMANSVNGSDHAWGNHQFIFGGNNGGGRLIGTMPDLDMGGKDDWQANGVWIPTTSVTQVAAGVSRWYGLTDNQLNTAFPDLSNFPSGPITLK